MNLITKIRRNLILNKIARLEHEEHFISPFFCGETNYPIKLKENRQALRKAKSQLAELAPKAPKGTADGDNDE